MTRSRAHRLAVIVIGGTLALASCMSSPPPPTPLPTPEARSDRYLAWEDTALSVPSPGLLANDDAEQAAVLTVEGDEGNVGEAISIGNGTLLVSASGAFTFAPNPSFVGQESFTYEVGHEEARSATTATVLVSQPWSTLGAMPEPVSRAAAVWLDGRMYVLGGEGNAGDRAGLVQMYDPELDSWDSSGPAMPAPVSNVCAAAVGDDIYVIGGSGALSTTDAVQRFSTTDRVWTSLTLDALPTARWTTACATLDDVIYVFGGTTADQANGSDELLAFDPSLPVGERWITGLSRAPVVSQFAAVVPYGDRLLVTGLYNSASGDLTDVLAYLPGNDEWVPYTDLPEARGAGAAWLHDDVLYVGGGGYNSYLDSVVTYDLTEGAAGAWAATESLISGRRTVAFASDPATGWLYIAGGWNGNYMDSAEVGRLVTGAY